MVVNQAYGSLQLNNNTVGSISNFFSYSDNVKPVLTFDKKYTIYINNGNLIIRSTSSTLGTFKIISLSNNNVITKIKVSRSFKVALFFPSDNLLKIIDIHNNNREQFIIQSSIEEIDDFEWFENTDGTRSNEDNNFLAVYSKHGISLKLYALSKSNESPVCFHTINKYISKIIKNPNSNFYSILFRKKIKNQTNKNYLMNFVVTDHTSFKIINTFDVKDVSISASNNVIKSSPSTANKAPTFLIFDSITMNSFAIYNFLGFLDPRLAKQFLDCGYSVEKSQFHESEATIITCIEWVSKASGEQIIALGNVKEKINIILDVNNSLGSTTLQHGGIVNCNNGATIFEEHIQSNEFTCIKSGLFSLPREKSWEKSSLTSLGINNIKFNEDRSLLISTAKSMPRVLFLWNLSVDRLESSPSIIISSFPILNFTIGFTDNKGEKNENQSPLVQKIKDNLIIINNGTSLIVFIHDFSQPPKRLEVSFDLKILHFELISIEEVSGSLFIKLICYSDKNFVIITHSMTSDLSLLNSTTQNSVVSLFQKNGNEIGPISNNHLSSPPTSEEDTSLRMIRQGSSPIGKEETDTRVRNIINYVQQSEWAPSNLKASDEDTFANKKRKTNDKIFNKDAVNDVLKKKLKASKIKKET